MLAQRNTLHMFKPPGPVLWDKTRITNDTIFFSCSVKSSIPLLFHNVLRARNISVDLWRSTQFLDFLLCVPLPQGIRWELLIWLITCRRVNARPKTSSKAFTNISSPSLCDCANVRPLISKRAEPAVITSAKPHYPIYRRRLGLLTLGDFIRQQCHY